MYDLEGRTGLKVRHTPAACCAVLILVGKIKQGRLSKEGEIFLEPLKCGGRFAKEEKGSLS